VTQANYFDVIFTRKSIRKYDLNPIDDKTLLEIEAYIKKVETIYDNIKTEIRIVSKNEVTSLLPVKAPQYLVMSSENKEGYLTNAGYMLEQIDLYLSSRGIGCCYLGMTQPTKAIKKESDLEFVMVLAFGNAAEPIHRIDVSEFKRKSLPEITNIINYDEILEPIRLAPSASNSQPWYFTGGAGVIHAYCVKGNFIKALIYEKMNKIDMGIALCLLNITAAHYGRRIEFSQDKTAHNNPPKGYYYISTILLK
jgi:nitroreductase